MTRGGAYDGRRVQAAIFDMDNTLFDFVSAKLRACNAVVEHLGIGDGPTLFEYFRRPHVGFEDHSNILDYLADIGVQDRECYDCCCGIYDEVKLASITPYPGIHDTLRRYRNAGLRLAVVTDAVEMNAIGRLKKVDLFGEFDCLVTPDISGKRKPEPDSFLLACRQVGVKAQDTMVIGDSPRRDIAPGRVLGMVTIYAAYGDRTFSEEQQYDADFTVREPSELMELVTPEGRIRPRRHAGSSDGTSSSSQGSRDVLPGKRKPFGL
jgi:putative hydrolase of the HAD superfamily